MLSIPTCSSAPSRRSPAPARKVDGETVARAPTTSARPSIVRASRVLNYRLGVITFVKIQLPKPGKSFPLFQLRILSFGQWLRGRGFRLRLRERPGRGLRRKAVGPKNEGCPQKSAKNCNGDVLDSQNIRLPVLSYGLDVRCNYWASLAKTARPLCPAKMRVISYGVAFPWGIGRILMNWVGVKWTGYW
jgi:hypothetical protein